MRTVAVPQARGGSAARATEIRRRKSPTAGITARFIEDKELVSIPGNEEALIEEAPPYQRWNAAYIDVPGPYDRHLPSTYYIAPPDPSWTPEERAAYIPGEADLLFVTIHEVWPGHFLQFLHSHRSESDPGRLFFGYGFAEGWAHYAEELMWEVGFGDGDPRLHIGQLQNALLYDTVDNTLVKYIRMVVINSIEKFAAQWGLPADSLRRYTENWSAMAADDIVYQAAACGFGVNLKVEDCAREQTTKQFASGATEPTEHRVVLCLLRYREGHAVLYQESVGLIDGYSHGEFGTNVATAEELRRAEASYA